MVKKNIKIAIPTTTSDGLNAPVTRHFGRCPFFDIVSIENGVINEVDVLENSAKNAMGGAGPMAVQLIVEAGATVVAGADYGPNAIGALNQGGVSSYGYPGDPNITAKTIVDLYLQEKLPLVTSHTSAGHVGMGRGQGMGQGRGQGRSNF